MGNHSKHKQTDRQEKAVWTGVGFAFLESGS